MDDRPKRLVVDADGTARLVPYTDEDVAQAAADVASGDGPPAAPATPQD